jgi:hypothetical protein
MASVSITSVRTPIQHARRTRHAALALLLCGGSLTALAPAAAPSALIDSRSATTAPLGVRSMADVRSFRAAMDTTIPSADGKMVPAVLDVLIVGTRWMRIDNPDGTVTTFDLQKRQALTLMPDGQQAVLMDLESLPGVPRAGDAGIIQTMRDCDLAKAEALGEKDIGGRKAKGYKLAADPARDIAEQALWVDLVTGLPLEYDERLAAGVTAGVLSKYTHFEWNPDFGADELSLTPPPGVTVVQLAADMSTLTEADVTRGLRAMAEMNGGRFPNALSSAEIQTIAGRGMERGQAGQVQTKMFPMQRTLMFVQDPKHGTNWHYAGAGLKLGIPNTPVLWYQPAGGTAWRVIDASLQVHEQATPPAGGKALK